MNCTQNFDEAAYGLIPKMLLPKSFHEAETACEALLIKAIIKVCASSRHIKL